MKKFIKLLTVGMILAGAFMLSGCSSRDDALVGTWVWEDDSSWVTTFNADGTGTHAISWGYGTSFSWTTPGNNIRWNYSGHPNMDTTYRIPGNTLYITTQEGVTFRYIRR